MARYSMFIVAGHNTIVGACHAMQTCINAYCVWMKVSRTCSSWICSLYYIRECYCVWHIGVFDLSNEYECEFALKDVVGMRHCHLRSENKNNTGRRTLDRTETKRKCKISPKSCISGVHGDCWLDDLLLAFCKMCDTLVSWNPEQQATPITVFSAQLVPLHIYYSQKSLQ
jgi:hypothetical protein